MTKINSGDGVMDIQVEGMRFKAQRANRRSRKLAQSECDIWCISSRMHTTTITTADCSNGASGGEVVTSRLEKYRANGASNHKWDERKGFGSTSAVVERDASVWRI